MHTNEQDLNLKRANSPLVTIEVDVDSLESQDLCFPDVIFNSLVKFAKKQSSTCFSIYTYFSRSVNFHQPTNSFFVGIIGNELFLDTFLKYLRSINGVRARFSDHIDPHQAKLEYHVENGYVWQSDEPGSWWCNEIDDQNQPEIDVDSNEKSPTSSENPTRYRVARNDSSIRTIKSTIENVFGLPEGSVALVKPDGSKIRSDATVGTLRKQWED